MLWLKTFVDLLFENYCLLCGESSGQNIVCSNCKNDFVIKSNYQKSFKDITIYTWGHYDGNLRNGIIALKSGKKRFAQYFAKCLVNFWKELPDAVRDKQYIVIPTPSHKQRIKERGYCQTTLIAKDFTDETGLSLSTNSIVRDKRTEYMNSLNNINERKENIKDAFQIISPINKENVLIIDDILTSGSTLNEIARIIHKHNPRVNIVGLTVAAGDRYN